MLQPTFEFDQFSKPVLPTATKLECHVGFLFTHVSCALDTDFKANCHDKHTGAMQEPIFDVQYMKIPDFAKRLTDMPHNPL